MRICLVSHSFYPATFYGGPISSTLDLSRKLGEHGIEVYVSTTNANGKVRLDVNTKTFVELSENLKVRYYHEQIIYYLSLSLILNLYRDIQKSDIVYIQYIFHYTVPFALLYSWYLKKIVVICPRASLSPWGLRWKGKLSYLMKKIWVNILIRPFAYRVKWQGCSHIETSDIKAFFPAAECHVVSDGVYVDSFSNSKIFSVTELVNKYANKEFTDVSDVVFSMGRLHEIKGFDILIDSFTLVLKNKPNAKLLIAGSDDRYKYILEKQIKDLNLKDSVFLIGIVNNSQKKELLSNASIFTLCSHVESFGIVVVEALACGTGVVVSDKTIWENLEDNKCGIFVNNEKHEFSKAIIKALNQSFSSETCVDYVRNRFDWDIVSKNFVNNMISS